MQLFSKLYLYLIQTRLYIGYTCEVQSTLQTLQLGKAAGPDSINNRLLKELAQPLSFPLSDIFNYSLSTGKRPSI